MSETTRRELFPGVWLRTVHTDKFKSSYLSITLLAPLDRDTAEWFAHRFGEDGTVYEAQIAKAHILAVFLGRTEWEVVVDPKYLEQVQESSAQDMGMEGMEMR